MLLKLYNKEHVPIGALTDTKDVKIEYVLSGEDSFEFSLSISDENIPLVEEEGYIRTKNNEYVIKAIDPGDGFKQFSCDVNVEDLIGKAIAKFDTSNNNINDTIRLAIAGTGWILADNNISKRRTVRLTNTNALEVLREVRKVFRVDFRYDAINKIIYVYEQLGEDRGVYFSDELNLKSFSIPSDTYDYATRLYCYGKDGLNISSVNNGKEYIENFQYSNKVIELIWEDSRYTDVNSLKEDAEAKLDEISKPKRTYQASISDLAKQSDEYKFLDFFLGDTITLLSKQEKFRDKQRIVKYIQYPDNPSQNSCELGNTTLTFEELQKENEAKNNTVDAITSDNGTVDGSKVEALPAENITNLDIEVGKIVDFTSINADITNLKSENVTITGKLNAIEGEFGTIKSNVSIIDQLTVTHSAEINELKGINATFSGELSALSGKFGTIESEVGKIQTLVNGNLSSENIQAGGITSDKLTIANGFITNAMIANLDVSKINAGDISTNKFRIKSDDGGIEIVGPTMQFKNKNNVVMLQLGQDAKGDFNFVLRGEDGKATLLDHTGIKKDAIADDLIISDMIASDAVGEKQINYSSFITGFNKDTNTNTIKSTKIMLNNQNQTLDVAFNSLKTQADGTKSLTESHSTTIGVMQGQISTAINNTQILKDGQTILLKDDYNRTVQTIDSMKSTIGSHTTQISGLNSTVSTQGSSISQLKNQIALKVEQTDIQTAINDLEISSRNLLKDSKSEYTNISISQWNGTFGRWGRKHCSEYGLKAGDTITFSVKIKPLSKSKLRARIDFYSESSGEVGKTTKVSTQIVIKGEEKVSSVTATIPEGVEYITLFVQNVDYTNDTTTTTEQYMHDMLTKGNKVVGWTPAPEDTDNAISLVDSKVTTTSNKVATIETNLSSITQRVSSTETTLSSTTATANSALSKLTLNEQTKMNGIELLPQGYKSNSGVNYKLRYNKTTFSNNSINITGKEWIYTDFIKIDRTKPLYWKIALTVSSNNLYYFGVERYDSNKNVINNASNNATIYFKNATGQSGTFEGYWQETDKSTAYVRLRFLNDWNYTGTATAKITELSWKQLGALVIDDLTTEITTTNSKVSSIETNLSSITSRVSSTETTLATTTSTANSALSQANTANNTANANKSSISSLTTRMSSAEQKITDSAIVSTVTSSTTYKNAMSGKVDTTKIISTINQTAEAVKINASKIQLEGTVTAGDSDGNYVQIDKANYTVRDSGTPKAFFGFRKMGKSGYDNYVVPKLAMGAYGYSTSHNYFTIVPYRGSDNPQGLANAYVDIAYHCLSPGDYSNIKMYDGGDIRIAPIKNLEITTNYTDGKYSGTGERRAALFSTSGYDWLGVHLQTGGISNHSNGYGLILSDRYRSDSWDGTQTGGGSKITSVRVNTDSAGDKFFRPTYENGTINLGSGSYKWKAVYSVNGSLQTCDSRFKENIIRLNPNVQTYIQDDSFYNFMRDMPLYQYNYKNKAIGYCQTGFLADELMQINREIASRFIFDSEDEQHSWMTSPQSYTANLHLALQQAMKKIDLLQEEINKLKIGV